MSAQPIRVAFGGTLTAAHRLMVGALLRLDDAHWLIVSGAQCDVVIRAANDDAADYPGVLELSLMNADGGVRDTADLRARIAGVARARATERTTEVASAATPIALHRAHELAERLRRSTNGERLFLCDDNGRGAWIDTAQQLVQVDPVIGADFTAWAAAAIQMRSYHGAEVEDRVTSPLPLDVFLWDFALARRWSLETLGIGVFDRVQLTRWPDFGRLERRRSFMRLTSHLTRKPTPVGELFEQQLAPDLDVLALLVAADLNGWLAVEPHEVAPAAAPPVVKAERTGMFAALRSLRKMLGLETAA